MGSLYSEEQSWLHAVPASWKLLVLALVSTGLFLTERSAVLLPAALLAGALYFSLGAAGRAARRLLRSILIACLLLGALHVLLQQPQLGLNSAARLLATALLGTCLTLTTRHTELLELIETLLAPLGRLGLRVDRLGLQLALMLRFIEHFFVQWQRLDDAHRLRRGRAGGLRLLAPLTIRMLSTAQRVADALQLRLNR
ncbi:MAG: hypothetical protein RJA44_1520 [Pseudomonadota bacterium]|jgi:biotin transport system permease protein